MDMSDYDGACEVLKWCGGRAVDFGPYAAVIPTLESEMFVQDGDWIIRGVKGEFYPCRADIFEMTYERE